MKIKRESVLEGIFRTALHVAFAAIAGAVSVAWAYAAHPWCLYAAVVSGVLLYSRRFDAEDASRSVNSILILTAILWGAGVSFTHALGGDGIADHIAFWWLVSLLGGGLLLMRLNAIAWEAGNKYPELARPNRELFALLSEAMSSSSKSNYLSLTMRGGLIVLAYNRHSSDLSPEVLVLYQGPVSERSSIAVSFSNSQVEAMSERGESMLKGACMQIRWLCKNSGDRLFFYPDGRLHVVAEPGIPPGAVTALVTGGPWPVNDHCCEYHYE